MEPAKYYSARSKRLEEQGEIAVRVRVDATSCATDFAIVMSSGYPELDEAAIKVAEASRYQVAVVDGVPTPGEVMFAVQFIFRN
jgi:TonB family protein